MTTIREVASRLNLSITTVSRALDGYDDVAEETRRRVLHVAEEMGYTPNRAARQLRRQRADTIGYILPAGEPQFADPFFSEFMAGLGDEAATHNFDLLVSAALPGSPAEQAIYQRWTQSRKVDGFVLNRIRLVDWRACFLAEQMLPFVSLERTLAPVEFVGVEVDARAGIQTLIAHLIRKGHRRIAFIGSPTGCADDQLKIQVDRFMGYQLGLEQNGLALEPALVAPGGLTAAAGYAAAHILLALPVHPSAIVCVNDLAAFGVLRAAHEHGLKIGQDLAVSGFDGLEDSLYTDPPLTSLDQPVYTIARRLVQMLLTCLSGETPVSRQVCITPNLLLRASTGDS